MVDIHSHLLYGIDDGPETLEQSLAMLQAAIAAGTTDIVATPHANPEFDFDPDLISERVAELQDAGGPIRIHTGCDFHLSYTNVDDAVENPTKYAINQKDCLLVELSDLTIFKNTESDFERLQKAGLRLIITHPERNGLLRQRLERLRSWVEMGCYLQVTGQSLVGKFGSKAKEFADKLMDENLVHFVASDAHDTRNRPPDLQEAFRLVHKKYGEKRAELLFVSNPAAALTGDPITSADPAEEQSSKKWFQVWKR
jgi:protein-tyrosine phosphatase